MLLEGGDIMAKPPRHGQIKVSTMKRQHMKQHLDLMTEHAQIAADYGAICCLATSANPRRVGSRAAA
jgi:hypothetical protein